MRKLLFLILTLTLCQAVSAQMAKFQALYILNFARNTSWPAEDASKPLVITVVGDNALYSEMRNVVANKQVGGRSISVGESATAGGLPKSDIIFLGESMSRQVGSLVAAQRGNKVMIVSGSKGHCAQGAGISFVADGGKLGFEIHEGNIERNGLKVTAKLLQLGKQVY